MEDTVSDFWRMIWEQHLELVLMLTNLEEYSKTKCAKYWPDSSESKSFGDVSVTHVSEKKCSGENLVLVCCSKWGRPVPESHADILLSIFRLHCEGAKNDKRQWIRNQENIAISLPCLERLPSSWIPCRNTEIYSENEWSLFFGKRTYTSSLQVWFNIKLSFSVSLFYPFFFFLSFS